MRALFMLLALPMIAACQDTPSWRAVNIGGIWYGAVMRSPVLVQVYRYDDKSNTTMGWNLMTQPITPSRGVAVTIAPKNAQYEVGDPYNVPIGGIRWDFEATPLGIKWTIRLASPGGADVVTVIPTSSSGTFTKIYGQ